ncbi:NAD(P)-binding domain-containing protein [Helicobacter pametensis]|uniref:NAD(P)-binding domain-containing protein n=1 Tax=Helicobacter pametensis TaxID=95149 RepID=UPI0004808DD6|nr:NAD(P)-binding domain-containing protein [Helicobacter pametensis]
MIDVAIVGAGTTGISTAIESKKLGVENVAIFEKGESYLTTIRKFYKDGKRVDRDYKGQEVTLKGSIDFCDGNKESTLDLFGSLLSSNQIDLKPQTDIERISKTEDGFELLSSGGESFKARFVVIAIGKMGQPNKPSYAIPLPIRSLVNFNANSIQKDEKLLIVGGGNSAVEYAYDLCKTNPTTLNYRRSEFARINDANAQELQKVISSGELQTKLGVDIVALSEDSGRVCVEFADSTKETYDRIIYAIGGSTPLDFLQKCKLELDEKQTPKSSEIHETSIQDLFIAGDIALQSGGSIAIGLNHGYEIAQEIAKRLKN